jgi:poly(3-hydroxybutyrate) depolymerase
MRSVTVSGVSSGGAMAVQMHVAHSHLVRGAAVVAGAPYYCAQGSVWAARYNCTGPGRRTPLPDVSLLAAETRTLAEAGRIDPVSNLHEAKVWLFSGTRDEVVRPAVMQAVRAYYLAFVPQPQVAFVGDVPAAHAMVTSDYGSACDRTAEPYINDCDFDAAGALLGQLYGALAAPSRGPSGRLLRFDQREFTSSPYSISMDDEGFVYVPDACRRGGCRVHVAFHGCRQGRQAVGETFAAHAGYNRWADANRLIVLYPQAISRNGWGPWWWPRSFVYNPNGCWDWWGYTGAGYHTRDAAQIRTVAAMLERLGARVAE